MKWSLAAQEHPVSHLFPLGANSKGEVQVFNENSMKATILVVFL